MLSHAWRTIVKRLHRLYPFTAIEYLVVVEATKRGEPHLHILYRGPYVAQKRLSAWLYGLTGAWHADIRAIKNQREVVRYVGKYITKKPAQFGTSKRYWRSYHYSQPDENEFVSPIPSDPPWLISKVPISMLATEYRDRGYRLYDMEPEYLYAVWSP